MRKRLAEPGIVFCAGVLGDGLETMASETTAVLGKVISHTGVQVDLWGREFYPTRGLGRSVPTV